MNKLILTLLMVVMVVTPCLAQKTTTSIITSPSSITTTITTTTVSSSCESNLDCESDDYCEKQIGQCYSLGICALRPEYCTSEYMPVCGCNGVTYGNTCSAAATGVSTDYMGECDR